MRHQRGRQWLWKVEALQHLGAVRAESQGAAAAAAAAGRCRQTWGWDHSSYIVLDQWYLTTHHVSLGNALKRCVSIGLPSACGLNPESRNLCRLHLTFGPSKRQGKKTKTSLAYCMGKRKKNHCCLPTVADMAADDGIVVEQTNTSRKKARKKNQAKVMHADKRGRCALNRIFSFLFFFQSNLSLVGTEASPFGGAGANAISSHA